MMYWNQLKMKQSLWIEEIFQSNINFVNFETVAFLLTADDSNFRTSIFASFEKFRISSVFLMRIAFWNVSEISEIIQFS